MYHILSSTRFCICLQL